MWPKYFRFRPRQKTDGDRSNVSQLIQKLSEQKTCWFHQWTSGFHEIQQWTWGFSEIQLRLIGLTISLLGLWYIKRPCRNPCYFQKGFLHIWDHETRVFHFGGMGLLARSVNRLVIFWPARWGSLDINKGATPSLSALYLASILPCFLPFFLALYLTYFPTFYLTSILTCFLPFFLAFYLASFLTLHLAFYRASIRTVFPTFFLAFYLAVFQAFYLTCVRARQTVRRDAR